MGGAYALIATADAESLAQDRFERPPVDTSNRLASDDRLDVCGDCRRSKTMDL